MTNTAIQIVAGGATCGLAAMAAFSGAVRETIKLEQLRKIYDSVLDEPVPDILANTLNELK